MCIQNEFIGADAVQVLLMALCVWEWRRVALSTNMRSLRSRVDEINADRRRLEKLAIIMRKVCRSCVSS